MFFNLALCRLYQTTNSDKIAPKTGIPGEIRTHYPLLRRHTNTFKLLNKLSVSELAELSKLSKAYISQVKSGKRPPSEKLLNILDGQQTMVKKEMDYFRLFLISREAMGVSPRTLSFYQERLSKFIKAVDYLKSSSQNIQRYLNSISSNQYGLSTRHASFRAIKTFYRWLQLEYKIPNPMNNVPAPILGKPILPSLNKEQVQILIDACPNVRDKTIIALFTESGLRLSELVSIRLENVDWATRTIKIMGKGRKEAYAPFGQLTEQYLKAWLIQYKPHKNIWGLNNWGIATMLRRLEKTTGLPCNPHTFRRTFACLLRKAGVDTMTIKDLGRWESLEMVQRYTRGFIFNDALKHYKAPLG